MIENYATHSLRTSTFEIHPSNFVSLPGHLFCSTQIPVCLWFLAKNKTNGKRRERRKQMLFVNARKLDRSCHYLTCVGAESTDAVIQNWPGKNDEAKCEWRFRRDNLLKAA